MTDLEDRVARTAAIQAVERQAITRHSMGSSAASVRKARFERLHSFYAPVDNDQWPSERVPGKLHITANIVKPFVDVDARVLSILPRITNKPPTISPEDAIKAEVLEELYMRYLEMTGWDVWMADRERSGALYGVKILKPYWNVDEDRPDVDLIEQPQNLMLGYGASDYSVVDWAIYKTALSALQVKIQYPDVKVEPPAKGDSLPKVSRVSSHDDPLGQKSLAQTMRSALGAARDNFVTRDIDGEYERMQIEVWDYWYLDDEGTVCNATLVGGCMSGEVKRHPEMPAIPFIVTQHDHEPGSSEGMSTAESILDVQMGLNRAMTHYAQLVADNTGTAYQLAGENADTVPENIVPIEDFIIPAGSGNEIKPILRGFNNYPLSELINLYWDAAHKITGLPSIMFGDLAGTQTSGRATDLQIAAASNRIDHKRRRSYEGLRLLLLFWGHMLKKRNPSVVASQRQEAGDEPMATAGIEAEQINIGDLLEGFENWKILPPEITPRNEVEHSNNIMNLVNAKLMPLQQGMDELGIENPQQMLALIEKERSNPRLFPGDVQAALAAQLLVQQIEQQAAAQEALAAQPSGADAAQGAAASQANLQQQQQTAAPTADESMNQPGTAPGGFPPPGAPSPGGGELQPIIRQTPSGESQAMSQVMLPRTGLGL